MEELLVAALSMIIILALIPLYLWKRRHDSRSVDDDDDHREEPQVPVRENVVRGPGLRRMRRRPASGASTSAAPPPVVQDTSDTSDEDGDGENNENRVVNRRERKRQEREAQRQAEGAARDSRQSKQDWYADMRRKKDEEREEQERLLEEEARAKKAKEDEAAALEFDKWKGEFSVDAEGTTENELQDGNQSLLTDFVDYIKKHKCVPLEDLAAEFKLRTQDCINRITSLEASGRLSGVMDDRGKYIYISMEEMKAVADYIKRQGRVSISHLASQSNQFIDLEPKSQFVEETANMDQISVA